MAHNRQCRITVLKCMCYRELADIYDPEASVCRRFQEGEEFILDQNSMNGYWHLMGGSFCAGAWSSASTYIDTILQGGTFDNDSAVKIVSCPNGIHPVIFRIERWQDKK